MRDQPPLQPSQWNCPNCGHEMVSSGVDMDTFEAVCQERDVAHLALADTVAALQAIVQQWREEAFNRYRERDVDNVLSECADQLQTLLRVSVPGPDDPPGGLARQ